MASVPRIIQERVDGGMGSAVDVSSNRFAVAGIASAGPLSPRLVTSMAALTALYVSGPLVDYASYVLSVTGRPVLCQRVAASVAGARGNVVRSGAGAAAFAVAAGGTNTSTAVPVLAGAPVKPYAVALRCTVNGANLAAGTARIQWSLDGGLTWSGVAAPVAGPLALGDSGVTLAWTDGTFVAPDAWTGTAVPGAQLGTATLAVTGDPADAYDVRAEVIREGVNLAAATATFRLSMDGGDTWDVERAMPVSGVYAPVGTGLTLTFANGAGPTSFRQGDTFACATTAPTYSSSGMATAYNALDLGEDEFEAIVWTGTFDAALCVSLEALCAASEAALRYRWCVVGLRDISSGETVGEWESSLRTDFAAWTGLHVLPVAGHAEVFSHATNRYNRRSGAILAAGRAAAVPVSEDLAWVGRGPLPGVRAIYYDGADHPSLNDFGFTTLRMKRAASGRGYYIVNPHTGAAPSSDFKLLQYLRVWNLAASILREAMEPYLSQTLRTVPKPLPSPVPPVHAGRVAGSIDEREAAAIEGRVNAMLSAALLEGPVQHAASVSMTLDRTNDITVAPRELRTSLNLGPLGYPKQIRNAIGFALAGGA